MSFRDDWNKDRERKRQERDAKQFVRRMSTPVMRGEVVQLGEAQMLNLASLALAMEALEDILVGAGILDRDELMDTMHVLAQRKLEQAQAAEAAANTSSLIAQV